MPLDTDDEPTTLAPAPIAPTPRAKASRRVERDEESTSFDPRPWGAQQRMLPDRRFARTSGPLQSANVAVIPSLPASPKPTIAHSLSRAPSQRIAFAPAPAAAALYPVALGPSPAAVMAPAQALVDAARASASAIADYVDRTLRVRRSPLTRRSLIAAPIGALVAAIVIALVSLGSSSAPRLAGSLQQTSELAPELAMPSAPPVLAAPVAAPPVEAAQFVAAASAAPTVEEPVAAPTSVAKPARAHHVHKRRKIVAVDSSTPLGNLRVRRF